MWALVVRSASPKVCALGQKYENYVYPCNLQFISIYTWGLMLSRLHGCVSLKYTLPTEPPALIRSQSESCVKSQLNAKVYISQNVENPENPYHLVAYCCTFSLSRPEYVVVSIDVDFIETMFIFILS